ncbi:hypothetical protein [uncultured Paracoccus sp.]|uniref:hypothetical protein n=1 Tax=uncultured Paracoccus sp. TaxID=189685 RepID=UPI0025D8D1A1|nr:hypothetical protein [uncultured Paracoccus sp.]
MTHPATLFLGGLAAGFVAKSLWDALDRGAASRPPGQRIRNAGRAEMENPPRRWDMVDEQGDESFPASDPPGNY